MKIKLSKSQWEEMGKKAGWMGKEAAVTKSFPAKINIYGAGNAIAQGSFPFSVEIETQIGTNTLQIPIGQNVPEVQELYQALSEVMQQNQTTPPTV